MNIDNIQWQNYLIFWSKYIELITIIPPSIVKIDGTSLKIKKDNIKPNIGNKE